MPKEVREVDEQKAADADDCAPIAMAEVACPTGIEPVTLSLEG
jgi:hypothetical protein